MIFLSSGGGIFDLLRNQPSNFAIKVDNTFYFILVINAILFLGLTTTMIYFIIKYSRKRHPKAEQIKDNIWLELSWTVTPVIIVLVMFYYGTMEYNPMHIPPKNAMKVNVIGRMWEWSFVYANGKQSDKLYLPVNKAVLLNLESKDVIHSLFIPAFRVKQDVVPGKNDNFIWFIPTQIDTFTVECSAYCGLRHSYMYTKAIILQEKDFNEWLAKNESAAGGIMPGLALMKNNACFSCHTIDGSKLVGPTFKGLYGTEVEVITNGKLRTVKADDEYIKTSIFDPNKDIVKDFNPVMQQYKGVLNDEQIKQITDYLKSIGKK
jgi:cytochrome c oxidase subunit II